MSAKCFYEVEFPKTVAKAVMAETGDKGNPNDLIMRIPVSDFSDGAYDEMMYGQEGVQALFFSLLCDGKITQTDYRAIRVYEVTMDGNKRTKTPCKYYDFRDATICGFDE